MTKLKRTATAGASPTPARAARPDTTNVSLPTEPNEPPTELTSYSFCIYGEKGVGKSSLSALFPDVSAHLMYEPARRGLRIPMIPKPGEEPLTWPRTQSYFDLLLNEYEPGRVNIDTLDVVAKMCQQYHADVIGVPSLLGLNDHGRGWDTMKVDWERTFNKMLFAGWRFTFLSHARNRLKVVRAIPRDDMKAAEQEGRVITEIQPTATGWSYDWMKIPVEFAAYYGWYGSERLLYVRGNQRMYAAAGVNEDHFLDPNTGQPYDAIPMGNSPKKAFANLQLAWDNKLEGYIIDSVEEYQPSE